MDELGRELEQNDGNVAEVEQHLRHCLQHVPAPEGFADRVMLRVAERESARGVRSVSAKHTTSSAGFGAVHRHAGWWTAIAAMLLLAVGGDVVHLRHQRQDREAAKVQQQMDLALQLTSHALDEVNDRVEHSGAARYTQMAYEIAK